MASTSLTACGLPLRVLFRPSLIVVAHPDDETLGLGSLFQHLRGLRAIIHVTDGAPRRGNDARNAGVPGRQEYAAIRREELKDAMNVAGLTHTKLLCLHYADQESGFHLARLSIRLAKLLRSFRPATVFTHPYEGGHPDHDSCALGVYCACLLLHGQSRIPEVFEFASYHAGPHDSLETECFLDAKSRVWPRCLSVEERDRKQRILGRFVSQRPVLEQFHIRNEPTRRRPQYRFSRPPHPGKLYYENFDWGMTGVRWRQLARRAQRTLALAHAQ